MTGILYSHPAAETRLWRGVLLGGVVLSALLAYAVGQPEVVERADPELAWLMRGMATIKACLVLVALSAVVWRLQWPAPRRLAVGYLLGVWLAVAATVSIWQLTFIAAAAITFHLGEALLLVLAWRDREGFAVAWAGRRSRSGHAGASGLDHAAAIAAVGSSCG